MKDLESAVIHAAEDSVRTAITKVLGDSYDSPLRSRCKEVFAKHKERIEGVFNKIVEEEIDSELFYTELKTALIQKMAKSIMNNLDGSFDKVLNSIKNDSVFRSKLTLLVNGLVDDFVKNKESKS